MGTVLRFNEDMCDFMQYNLKKPGISYLRKLAVTIYLDGNYVGSITTDGRITIGRVMSKQLVTFTETQWTAIALRAKEFKDRCARVAQEQAQEQAQALPHEAMETPAALYAG